MQIKLEILYCYGEAIPDCFTQSLTKQIWQALPFTSDIFQNFVYLGMLYRV